MYGKQGVQKTVVFCSPSRSVISWVSTYLGTSAKYVYTCMCVLIRSAYLLPFGLKGQNVFPPSPPRVLDQVMGVPSRNLMVVFWWPAVPCGPVASLCPLRGGGESLACALWRHWPEGYGRHACGPRRLWGVFDSIAVKHCL